MSTIRVKKDGHYFAASNIPFNDERLSWEARGVMGYLLSKPDNWTISRTDLIKRSDAGRDKVQRILKELETCGYVERTRCQRHDGTFFYETVINEVPTVTGKPVHGSAVHGEPVHLTSTDLTNTELNNSDAESATVRASLMPPPEKLGNFSTGVKGKAAAATLIHHPAIEAVKLVTNYYPRKNLHKRVIALLGETPDIPAMQEAFDTWTANGHNPVNLKGWLFDWHREGMHYVLAQEKFDEKLVY